MIPIVYIISVIAAASGNCVSYARTRIAICDRLKVVLRGPSVFHRPYYCVYRYLCGYTAHRVIGIETFGRPDDAALSTRAPPFNVRCAIATSNFFFGEGGDVIIIIYIRLTAATNATDFVFSRRKSNSSAIYSRGYRPHPCSPLFFTVICFRRVYDN